MTSLISILFGLFSIVNIIKSFIFFAYSVKSSSFNSNLIIFSTMKGINFES